MPSVVLVAQQRSLSYKPAVKTEKQNDLCVAELETTECAVNCSVDCCMLKKQKNRRRRLHLLPLTSSAAHLAMLLQPQSIV